MQNFSPMSSFSSRLSKLSFLSLSMACLVSCSLAPTFSPEQDATIELPDTFVGGLPKGESIANTAWWDLFKDSELKSLVQATLEDNRTLRQSAARIAEAQALVGFVRADQFPFLDISASAQRGDLGNAIGAEGIVNDFGAFGDLSFEVDLWGRYRNATAAQRHELLSSEYGFRSITISLVAQVAQLYFTLVDLDNRVAISNRTIANRHDATKLITARFSKGIIPMLDVNQAQIEEAEARIELASLERERRIVINALLALEGKTSGKIVRKRSLENTYDFLDIPTGVPAALLSRRPDVQAAEEVVRAEYARIGIAEAQRLPSLSLFGSLGLRSSESDDFFDSDSRSWNAGGGLFGPLLNWGKNKSRVEAQDARAEQALQSYEDTVIRAVQEVEDAIASIETYKQEYTARTSQRVAATNAARLSRARYNDGVAPYLEVLDVERSLFQAELGESATFQRYLSSIVQLYKALGGGWNLREDAPESLAANISH